MRPHSSHTLQPLDPGCFSSLNRAYEKEVRGFANSHIEHIDKKAFFASFKEILKDSFSKESIQSSSRATGLVPHNPEIVLSKLEVEPRTPTPLLPGPVEWQPKTPSNAPEIEAQSALVHDRIRQHNSSSPASIIEMVTQSRKSAEMVAHSQALLAAQVVRFETANEAASERKQRKKRRIQKARDPIKGGGR